SRRHHRAHCLSDPRRCPGRRRPAHHSQARQYRRAAAAGNAAAHPAGVLVQPTEVGARRPCGRPCGRHPLMQNTRAEMLAARSARAAMPPTWARSSFWTTTPFADRNALAPAASTATTACWNLIAKPGDKYALAAVWLGINGRASVFLALTTPA